jgi:hypothetical protein
LANYILLGIFVKPIFTSPKKYITNKKLLPNQLYKQMMKSLLLTALLSVCISFVYGQTTKSFPQFPEPSGPLTPSGHVRCYSMEADAYSRQLHQHRGSLNDFESWLEPHVRAYKDQLAAGYRAPLLTIPVVFHIITDGAGAENLSAAIIQAQLDQLNIDFRNLAGSTDPAAADVEVEFCLATLDPSDNIMPEPGINRVTTYGDAARSTNFIDNTIKPATIWPPTEYMNIWVCNIQGGVLGYAQFPDASGLPGMPGVGGAANTDGVVVGFGTVGSIANPGSAPPYNLGRTLTHEVGHWVGLRHIWGDGNCTVDDFCGDTPESDASNFGCPNHSSCGTPDMVENYMDYTDDVCMDIFTADQKARIRTVFNLSPRRLELPNSTKCGVPTPIISFANPNSTTVSEGTDCGFQDVVLDLQISMGATDAATVTFNATGTASGGGLDYEFFPASVVFPAGSTANQQVTVRIYNDGVVEADENLLLDFTVATTGDAVATTGDGIDHEFFITDDDLAPANAGTLTILSEDFEGGGLGSFTTQGAGGSDRFQNGNTASSASAFWTTDGSNASLFAYTNDDDCNCNKSNDRLTSPVFSLAGGYASASLTFDHAFADFDGTESGEVQINTGTGWTTIFNLSNTSVATTLLTTPWVSEVVDLTPYIGQTNVQIRFRYDDGGGWEYGMAVDNVEITAGGPVAIQLTDNTALPRDIGLRANETVHFYDVASGDVMGTIENTSTWDYGCTRMEVDRDQPAVGGAAAAFWDTDPSNFLMAKTFYIDPASNNASGTYNVTFYFTEAEIAAWEAVTGKARADLKIVKVQNNPISAVNAGNYTSFNIEILPATLTAFGADWTLTANFTSGFSGFGFGDPVITILNAELIDVDAKRVEDDIKVIWSTASEEDNDYFIVEKSTNGLEFEEMTRVDAEGNSNKTLDYSVLDQQPFNGLNYYRIITVGIDGSTQKSKVVAVDMDKEFQPAINIAPNPVASALNLTYLSEEDGALEIEIYDALGQLVYQAQSLQVFEGDNQIHLNVNDFAQGMYLIRISQNGIAYTKRFVKE